MEILTVGTDVDEKRKNFFRLLFGTAKGLMCIAFITDINGKKKYSEEFYEYPDQIEEACNRIAQEIHGSNIYFCSQLFNAKKRVKENVELTPNAWADLDTCAPENLLVAPSLVLESSPGRFQGFWVFDSEVDPDEAQDISRRIAYKHADQGADKSGWDLTQLLRVPYTYNYKYNNPPIVKVVNANRNRFRFDDFAVYPQTQSFIKVDEPMPQIATDKSAEDLLEARRNLVNPLIWTLFYDEPETDSWSEVLWKLLTMLHESDFTRDEVFIIAQGAACNKYSRDGRPARQLWKDVIRAEARVLKTLQFLQDEEDKPPELLSQQELEILKEAPETFVERYIKWASTLTDASKQYHQAGAFIALSSMLAGSMKLPTSYGTIVPNIWFMILADTTLTRKTTAMDIAMSLIEDIDDDTVMATDGSIEGLLTTLSTRPGKPSIFLRDEFSGLLEQMTKKDYMSGMPELLTKLYDAKMQKRVLRKDVIEVREPRLIIFAGGIKDNVTSLLTMEQVSSGFIPRFVFITAESDTSKITPIGPPTEVSRKDRDVISSELMRIHQWYNKTQELFLEKLNTTVERRVDFECELTPDAWFRYNKLETTLLQAGIDSDNPQVLTPIGDRLSKSMLKCAMLIAASRQTDDKVVITELDLLRAINYGREWYSSSLHVIKNIGKGVNERLLDRMMEKIRNKPEGASRSNIMQTMHIDARMMVQYVETLKQRDLITVSKRGRTEILVATKTLSNRITQ